MIKVPIDRRSRGRFEFGYAPGEARTLHGMGQGVKYQSLFLPLSTTRRPAVAMTADRELHA
jgi:hypothetical protein